MFSEIDFKDDEQVKESTIKSLLLITDGLTNLVILSGGDPIIFYEEQIKKIKSVSAQMEKAELKNNPKGEQ